MDGSKLVAAVISFLTALFMFFIILVFQQVPLAVNTVLNNGVETNKIVFNGLTYLPMIIALLLAVVFLFLHKKK